MSDEDKAAVDMLNGVMRGMLEGMATQTAASNLVGHIIEDESRAWDGYIGVALTTFAPGQHGLADEEVSAYAVVFADAVLKARRERFGVDQASRQMTSALQTMNEKCGNLIVGGTPCSRPAHHEGVCRS